MPTDTRLANYITRLQRMDEEAKANASDRKDLIAEVKSAGYDTKVVNQVVKVLGMDAEKRREYEDRHTLVQTYLTAVE